MADSETMPDTGTSRGALARELFPSDIQAIARAVERGFPIANEDLESCVKVCREIMLDSRSARRTRLIAVKAMAVLQGQNQKDRHHIEKMQHESGILDLRMQRAEQGKPNDCISIVTAPVRELPLPDAMRAMRLKVLEPSQS